MKEYIATLLLLSSILAVKAQENGINFLKDTKWNDALSMAKAQNKLIFVDVYTDWCGPCKTMDAEIFPLKVVGDKYNRHFINYKLDAEKGEGPALKAKYSVKTYPNYLFINGDGVLIYRSTSSMPANEFLLVADQALAEAKQPETILQLDERYPASRKDKDFMYTYLRRKTDLRSANPDLVDEYIGLLNDAEKGQLKNLQLILDNGGFLSKNLQLGIAINTLIAHKDQFPLLQQQNKESLQMIIDMAKETTLAKAIANKDEQLLKRVLDLSQGFEKDFANNRYTIGLSYYWGTKQTTKYVAEAMAFADHHLLKIPADTLDLWDQNYLKRATASAKSAQDMAQYKHTQTIRYLRLLNDLAQNIAVAAQKRELEAAKKYSDKVLKMTATDPEYYKNVWPFFVQTNAVINYKLGNKALAIDKLEAMIAQLNQPKATEYFAPLLNKMKANQKL
ncbi:thioredoxin family protein [Pedobacter sp. KR3-3]|uniref:Thioredoxin family protein n=1 Tax=Pedobacter albus TaxID=3113905 RepID=A0ABU7I8R8_9SPHI|nr:thioredoxin family protein [Pedobacter sp. KR3-3]MEE1945769.1 thioredoxin family protein [Pedobacter sp. KR3-3]